MTPQNAMKKLVRGDYVRLRRAEDSSDWTPGFVALASEETRPFQSVIVLVGDFLRGSGGAFGPGPVPLCVDYVGEKITGLLDGCEYDLDYQDTQL